MSSFPLLLYLRVFLLTILLHHVVSAFLHQSFVHPSLGGVAIVLRCPGALHLSRRGNRAGDTRRETWLGGGGDGGGDKEVYGEETSDGDVQ
ncbi:hypothetical protein E2C01_057462 [Portunus trituberculatus]|uniref:Secreted protein n=1 Tax=Portunus trituberculatus TaxID=210409 RepID=A0A5B7H3E6_PORTR|nr:hypothetical protein [Portunus trituberculatus]